MSKSFKAEQGEVKEMIMALIGTAPPIPFYTCKHCGEGCYFLIHDGRWWKCKNCFKGGKKK